jgi:hypothetical protein
MTLASRAEQLRQRFPESMLNGYKLRELYRRNRITKQKLVHQLHGAKHKDVEV